MQCLRDSTISFSAGGHRVLGRRFEAADNLLSLTLSWSSRQGSSLHASSRTFQLVKPGLATIRRSRHNGSDGCGTISTVPVRSSAATTASFSTGWNEQVLYVMSPPISSKAIPRLAIRICSGCSAMPNSGCHVLHTLRSFRSVPPRCTGRRK